MMEVAYKYYFCGALYDALNNPNKAILITVY